MNEQIIHTIDIFAIFVGLIGTAVIITGVVHGLKNFIALEMGAKNRNANHDMIRFQLGTYLLL